MDEERLGELLGRIIATLEHLNKSDDDLKSMIDESRRSRRENFKNVWERLRSLESRVSDLEGRLKIIYLVLGIMLSAMLGGLFYSILV